MARTDDNSLFGIWAKGVPTKTLPVDISGGDFEVPELHRIIMVSTAGNVAIVQHDGSDGLLPALQPGAQVVFSAKAIKQTGTTATGIVLQA